MKALVFDTSVLSPFARAGLLGLLERITAGHLRHVTRDVLDELSRGTDRWPELGAVAASGWLQPVKVESVGEFVVFAVCSQRLVSGSRNVGECATLAWAEVHGAVAVTDDQVAYDLGRERGIPVVRSLRLLGSALRAGILGEAEAEKAVDLLLSNGARLPFQSGADFLRWFRDHEEGQ